MLVCISCGDVSVEQLLLFSIVISQASLLMDLEFKISWQTILRVLVDIVLQRKKNCACEHGKIHSNDESKMALIDCLINIANSVNKALDPGGLLDLQH